VRQASCVLPDEGYARGVRSPPLRPASRPILLVVFVGCVLLLVACAPRVVAGADPAMRNDPRPSAACSSSAAPLPSGPLVVHGQERSVLFRVPEAVATQPRDLVIVFHGRTNDAAQVRRYTELDEALPDAVIVYPSALSQQHGSFAWSAAGDPPERLRDFALVDAVVDAFGRAHCLDLDRVFVVGHSLGASFANDVACRFGDRVRAVASVAGGLQGGPCLGPTAALVIHHPDDPLVPVEAGERVRDAFRAANSLATETVVPATHPVLARLRCVRYGDDDAPDPVVWCPHDDATGPGGRPYAHTWPDAAAEAIAVFFAGLP
jgi:polyhydroxybutyrate depolymerase